MHRRSPMILFICRFPQRLSLIIVRSVPRDRRSPPIDRIQSRARESYLSSNRVGHDRQTSCSHFVPASSEDSEKLSSNPPPQEPLGIHEVLYRLAPSQPLQILLPCSRYPASKHRTADRHIDLIERVHNGLNPVFVDFCEELLDGLFGLRRCGVRSYRCACSSRG